MPVIVTFLNPSKYGTETGELHSENSCHVAHGGGTEPGFLVKVGQYYATVPRSDFLVDPADANLMYGLRSGPFIEDFREEVA
jgi:hypothetical protein